ncbi:ABC transporter permease [Dielma fastidiosa]|uniref:Peptide/nickel transport system permease protein n=1 Tax=Dielma fastidiosa TaxID=1034346 RepID=A0A318KNB6_9FIRM|nr:ABC transporter permease [Dielma fastidiosa]PXX77285.1 peptide/nickel transport system permease protein [Dielma fastidiosa]
MRKYVTKRILLMFLLLLGMSFLVFASLYIAPGDPAELVAGANATPEDIIRVRAYLGLDQPFLVQYGVYLKNLLTGNLGTSLTTRQPILQEIIVRLPHTLNLACSSMIVALVIGIPTGIIAAIKKDTFIDNLLTTTSLAGISIPNFWLGSMLILLFSVTLRWLPTGGMNEPFWTTVGFKQAILPSISLGLAVAAGFTRIGRSAMLDVLQSDYIRTAKSKGIKGYKVILIHALRNAMIPIITQFGTSFGGLLGGAIITEQVFVINGVGTYLINAINQRNYPVVQSTVLVIAAMFIIVNLIVDLVYVLIDPRISYE